MLRLLSAVGTGSRCHANRDFPSSRPSGNRLLGAPGPEGGPYSPLMVRCTQLPLWKVSYCWSSMSTLHSYQPWSSERTCSRRSEALS